MVAVLAVALVSGCSEGDRSDGGNGNTLPTQEFFNFNLGFCQFHYQTFGGQPPLPNSPFGGITIFHDLPPGPYFFNCAIQTFPTQHQWQLKNVPIFGRGAPTETYLPISWQELQTATGQPQIQTVNSGHQLSSLPLLEPPPPVQVLPVNPYNINYFPGIESSSVPPLPLPDELPFVNDFPEFPTITFECGMHATFTNQDCGECECCPAAVSNSLKTIGVSTAAGPMMMPPGGPLEINDMKTPTGFTAPSAPGAGDGGVAITWFNMKGPALMASHGVTTASTALNTAMTPAGTAARITTICDMLANLNAGKDVEMQNGHHIGMVTAIWKITVDGMTSYTIDVAHDIDQGNAGGLVNESLGYDPATNTLSGGAAGFFRNTSPTHFTVETKP